MQKPKDKAFNVGEYRGDRAEECGLSSKVRVDMRLCRHETEIEAKDRGDGVLDITITSECKDIQYFAKLISSLGPEDYTDIKASKVYDLASQAKLTPTCLIPAALFNACWIEAGMISKNLAKKEEHICIHFLG